MRTITSLTLTALYVALIIYVVYVNGNERGDYSSAWLYISLTVAASLFTLFLLRRGPELSNLVQTNGLLEERIKNSLTFFGKAKEEIVIVSGYLSDEFYDNPAIIELFKRKLDDVEIIIYVVGGEGVSSKIFPSVITSHNNGSIIVTPKLTLKNMAVVDSTHLKIEEIHASGAEHIKTTYFMFHRAMARQALTSIRSAIPYKTIKAHNSQMLEAEY